MSELQTSLKTETLDHHKEAENHLVMQSFMSGNYKKEHLLRFLVNLLPLYQVVEQRLLQPYILVNSELRRSHFIEKDIELLKKEFMYSENLGDMLTPLDVTAAQVAHDWEKPTNLLCANLYARWLADFYGGRMMGKMIAPFNNMYTSTDSGRVIKEVREIVDTKGQYTEVSAIVNEVKAFFKFHVDLFDKIGDASA